MQLGRYDLLRVVFHTVVAEVTKSNDWDDEGVEGLIKVQILVLLYLFKEIFKIFPYFDNVVVFM